jgi:hypothetical protein
MKIDMSRNNLSPRYFDIMMASIAKLPQNQNLQLSENRLGAAGCFMLTRILSNKMYKYQVPSTKAQPSEPRGQQYRRWRVHNPSEID